MNFKNRSLGFQVTALMLFIALAAGVVGAIGIYGMNQMHDASNQVYQQDVVPMNLFAQMHFDAQAYRSNVVLAVSARNPQEQQNFLQQVDQEKDAMLEMIAKLEAFPRSPAQANNARNSINVVRKNDRTTGPGPRNRASGIQLDGFR